MNDYALENAVNESVRVIVYDTSNNQSQKDITFNIFRDDDISPTISSAGTVSFDFLESEGTVAVISKHKDHSFSIGDVGTGTNTPNISATTGNITAGTVSGVFPVPIHPSRPPATVKGRRTVQRLPVSAMP